ncbi:SOUL family heme-binding protein [Sphingomonas oligophenolica]|uniref:Heme-binding protein n=1 Tax=Sphingomonas oligophenolica TaxID=301154 RepID=A0A502CM24_9SPHN|nr:heme-binding protein [Sphingomonas oligophenolica]TPG12751.1 heme-binding protein [Sphingomonas oligophenolica]
MKTWTRIAAIGGGLIALTGAASALFKLREKSVEQPDYTSIETGAIELRDYPDLLVVETLTSGERDHALGEGFRRLVSYIGAKKRGDGASEQPIAMTAPVLQDRAGGRWRTRFVMPATMTSGTLPTPAAGVGKETLAPRRVAAIRFAGLASDDTLRARERTLREWLVAKGHVPAGAAEYAFYNSPMVAPPLRRNEVLIPIAR